MACTENNSDLEQMTQDELLRELQRLEFCSRHKFNMNRIRRVKELIIEKSKGCRNG